MTLANCFDMKRKKYCRQYGCSESPFSGGLCEQHNAESLKIKQRNDDAVYALHHSKVDGTSFVNTELRDEFYKLQEWWRRACNSVNYSRIDATLKDEANYAVDWCIALTKELIDAERASRLNISFDELNLNATRQWVWERFNNLEKGLISNGVKRTT